MICSNREPSVLVHYVALIGNHSVVRITQRRWRCCSLGTQRPLSLLLSMMYQLLMSITYQLGSSCWRVDSVMDSHTRGPGFKTRLVRYFLPLPTDYHHIRISLAFVDVCGRSGKDFPVRSYPGY